MSHPSRDSRDRSGLGGNHPHTAGNRTLSGATATRRAGGTVARAETSARDVSNVGCETRARGSKRQPQNMNGGTREFWGSVVAANATTLTLLWLLPGVPAVGLAAGMVTAVVALLLAAEGRKRYAVVGTGFLLSTGLALAVVDAGVGGVPSAGTLVPATLVFGLVSLLVVAVRAAGRSLVRATVGAVFDPKAAERILDAATSVLSAIGLLFLLSKLKRKVVVHGSFAIGGNLTFGLSLLGAERTVTVPGTGSGVDVVLFLFVGTLLAGFYTFDSLNSAWIATKSTAKASVETGKRAGTKTASVIGDRRSGEGEESDDE